MSQAVEEIARAGDELRDSGIQVQEAVAAGVESTDHTLGTLNAILERIRAMANSMYEIQEIARTREDLAKVTEGLQAIVGSFKV